MTRPGTEPRSPGPLANTLTARPLPVDYSHKSNVFLFIYIYIYVCNIQI